MPRSLGLPHSTRRLLRLDFPSTCCPFLYETATIHPFSLPLQGQLASGIRFKTSSSEKQYEALHSNSELIRKVDVSFDRPIRRVPRFTPGENHETLPDPTENGKQAKATSHYKPLGIYKQNDQAESLAQSERPSTPPDASTLTEPERLIFEKLYASTNNTPKRPGASDTGNRAEFLGNSTTKGEEDKDLHAIFDDILKKSQSTVGDVSNSSSRKDSHSTKEMRKRGHETPLAFRASKRLRHLRDSESPSVFGNSSAAGDSRDLRPEQQRIAEEMARNNMLRILGLFRTVEADVDVWLVLEKEVFSKMCDLNLRLKEEEQARKKAKASRVKDARRERMTRWKEGVESDKLARKERWGERRQEKQGKQKVAAKSEAGLREEKLGKEDPQKEAQPIKQLSEETRSEEEELEEKAPVGLENLDEKEGLGRPNLAKLEGKEKPEAGELKKDEKGEAKLEKTHKVEQAQEDKMQEVGKAEEGNATAEHGEVVASSVENPTDQPSTSSTAIAPAPLHPLQIVSPIYGPSLLHAARLYRRFFPRSPYAQYLLAKIKELGPFSYVLGASTALYNEILYLKWVHYRDLDGCGQLVEEMVAKGLQINTGTLAVIEDAEKVRKKEQRAGKLAINNVKGTSTTASTAAGSGALPKKAAELLPPTDATNSDTSAERESSGDALQQAAQIVHVPERQDARGGRRVGTVFAGWWYLQGTAAGWQRWKTANETAVKRWKEEMQRKSEERMAAAEEEEERRLNSQAETARGDEEEVAGTEEAEPEVTVFNPEDYQEEEEMKVAAGAGG